MLIDAPRPPSVIDEMRVTFLPQFLGTSPRALRPPGVTRDHGDVGRELVHEHQPPRIHRPQAFSPSTSRLLVPLGGTQRLF